MDASKINTIIVKRDGNKNEHIEIQIYNQQNRGIVLPETQFSAKEVAFDTYKTSRIIVQVVQLKETTEAGYRYI